MPAAGIGSDVPNALARKLAAGGFSLIELLVVMAIMAVLTAVTLPSIEGLNSSGKFNQSISEIAGILEQARSYAVGQNTYVWVAFYPLDSSQLTGSQQDMSGNHLIVATYASNDGTDPIKWNGGAPYTIPYTSPTTGTVISPIFKLRNLTQLLMAPGGSGQSYLTFNNGILPGAMTGSVASPAANVTFQCPLPGTGVTLGQQPVPNGDQECYLVEYTPLGDAQVAPGFSNVIRMDCQPMKAKGIVDNHNIASLGINGLTGLTTVYRQ
jgi:prepilin-type N-terminal cleavage/methylation domain-containing protein